MLGSCVTILTKSDETRNEEGLMLWLGRINYLSNKYRLILKREMEGMECV